MPHAFADYRDNGKLPFNKHVINRALVISGGGKITEDHIIFKPKEFTDTTLFEFKDARETPKTLQEVEKLRIEEELAKNKGDLLKTARSLGITEKSLTAKIKKYELTTK